MGIFSRSKKNSTDYKKMDGVIEAVRRNTDGKIQMARYYERRGSTWSDHMLIQREDLVKRVKNGEKFAIGERLMYMAGTFDVFSKVKISGNNGQEKLVTDKSTDSKVELQEAPLF
jgi:hypothetical protein